MRRLLILILPIVLAFLAGVALADGAGDGDKAALKQIVQGQLDAFRRGDGAAAYGYASPGIRAMFPTPDQFIGMVRQAYPPVFRSSSVAFGEVSVAPGGLAEKVYITAADGSNWIALYSFEKQPDGSWKISGCLLLKDTAPTI